MNDHADPDRIIRRMQADQAKRFKVGKRVYLDPLTFEILEHPPRLIASPIQWEITQVDKERGIVTIGVAR